MALGTLKRSIASTPSQDDGSGRPPSVSPALWRAVPEHLREDAVRRAARDLRQSIHPETSVTTFLKEKGLSTSSPKPTVRDNSSPTAATPTAIQVRSGGLRRRPSSAIVAASPERLEPLKTTPLSLSEVLLKEMGDKPTAAAAEREILVAITKDPVMASDPVGLLSMGIRIPVGVLEAASDAIRVEAEKSLVEFRNRKAAGYKALSGWVDPDDWSFNKDEAEDDCQRRPSI